MQSMRLRVGARAAVLALILGVLARVGSAHAAEAGRYAPDNIEQTYKQVRWLCIVAALCPVSDDVRIVIKRAMEGKPSAEYLLGLTLLTGDGLPRDESAGIAWTVRAAEHGDPDAARDIADRLRNGASIEVDETKSRRRSSNRPMPATPRPCARSARCISAAAALSRIWRSASI